jgi:Flp pilus assembly pilin Flp
MTKLYDTVVMRVAVMIQGLSRESFKREEGQTLAEYALILAGIAVVVVVAIGVLGGKINGIFQGIGSDI